jgi:RsiW-degrading membrane proteinase PrsW (M82 family)
MTLLSYNDTATETVPALTSRVKFYPKLNRIAFWSAGVVAIIAAFIFGYTKAGMPGLLITLAALVPFGFLVLISLLSISRAALPLGWRLAAATWGGAGATSMTFLLIGVQNTLVASSNQMDSIVVQAAMVEESAKALFLFTVLAFFRKRIRTPLMGAMMGLLVGAGFAFVENIIYFSSAYLQGGAVAFWSIFLARAVMSFFLHSLATMFTGLFIGYAVSKQFRFWKRMFATTTGLIAAMTIHGMWNGSASLTTVSAHWNLMYGFFWIPFVVSMSVMIIFVIRADKKSRNQMLEFSSKAGVIRPRQAERMSDRKERKKVYKSKPTNEVILWERSIFDAEFWRQEKNALPSKARYERRRNSLSQQRDKELLRLASVRESV